MGWQLVRLVGTELLRLGRSEELSRDVLLESWVGTRQDTSKGGTGTAALATCQNKSASVGHDRS